MAERRGAPSSSAEVRAISDAAPLRPLMRIGTRGSALALAQAEWVADGSATTPSS